MTRQGGGWGGRRPAPERHGQRNRKGVIFLFGGRVESRTFDSERGV